MTPLATYSFLPWLRQGLASQVTSADFDPQGPGVLSIRHDSSGSNHAAAQR
jgi:hypothetical protein